VSGRFLRSLEDPATLGQFVRELREGIYITNARGRVLDANPALLEILGFPTLEALQAVTVADLWARPAERIRQVEQLAREGTVREFELEIARPDGTRRTVLDTCHRVVDPESGEALFHGILVDITARKELERQLVETSRRDPLTGLLNRRFLAEFAGRFETGTATWGVIVVDIDGFKQVNDRLGHGAGDAVLCAVARFLGEQVRREDHVVRFGGDEFLVLLVGRSAGATAEVAARVRRAEGLAVRLSAGWARRAGDEPLERTVGRADAALLAGRAAERGVPDDASPPGLSA